MALNRRPATSVVHGLRWLLILLVSYVSYGTQNDVLCLKKIKDSFQDRYNNSITWDFSNGTEGAICRFNGIDCWHPDESRVLNIKLTDLGLKGQFPLGLNYCTSLTGLDLSGNMLSGSLPLDISKVIGYVTTLDLSNNDFSGEIPEDLSNCSVLNDVDLSHNRFSGQIPLQLGNLSRIKSFNVANNNLFGQVPQFDISIPKENYANNPGLCGAVLGSCESKSKSQLGYTIGGSVVGLTLLIVLTGIASLYISRMKVSSKEQDNHEGNKWTKSMKGTKAVKVSMFDKSISKMSLDDFMKASNSFSSSSIVSLGQRGTMYKATLPNGARLMVKRLQGSQRMEKEFLSEINTLGSVKHQNLVPILGFCIAKKERFLVYKYMANGNLYDHLHPSDPEAMIIEWPVRLKIAIGTAKGLAWLHHNCNPRTLHRNISSKCIFLDEDFEPKLSDYGLARLMNPIGTHLGRFVNGEFGDLGYVPPEYPRTLVATTKGDIYSFGTVLLELITGENPIDVANAPKDFKGSLVEWISQLSSNSDLHSAIDKSLLGEGVDNELLEFLRISINCVSSLPKERPTMFEVYQLLRAIGERYHFTADDDELMVATEAGDSDFPCELIVAQL